MPENTIAKIEKGRAEFAFNCAKNVIINTTFAKSYKSYVKKLPMLIKTNGLAATFAFVLSKANGKENDDTKAYEQIGADLLEWLKSDRYSLFNVQNLRNTQELVEYIISLDSITYRRLTAEIIAFLGWLRRFADGLVEGD